MWQFDTDASLDRICKAIPPPANPLETAGPLEQLAFADGRPVTFPPDYLRLVSTYGSGYFDSHERSGQGTVGMLVAPRNPRAASYAGNQEWDNQLIREFKREMGDHVYPYDVHPISPGLLPWGWAHGRKKFYWYTDGPPERWPVVVLVDLDLFYRFEIPMAVYLEQLLLGKLDCDHLGWRGELLYRDPAQITFQQYVEPGGR